MRRPTGRKPTERGTGEVIASLAEVPYKHQGEVRGWRVQVQWTDPPVKRKPGTDGRRKKWLQNWREAEKFAETKFRELEKDLGRSTLTFDEACEAWLARCERRVRMKNPDLTAHVLYNYKVQLNPVRRKFAKVLLDEIKSHDVEDWFLTEAEQVSYSTLQTRLSLMTMVLRNAQNEGHIVVHPFAIRKVKIPGKKRARVKVPDASDMRALMAFMNAPKPPQRNYVSWSCLRVAIALAANAGLRAEEVCALRWDHIDPHTGELAVLDAIVGGFGSRVNVGPLKTETSRRRIPINHNLRQLISEHAEFYKEWFGDVRGWPVGHVVRPSRIDAPRPYLTPHQLSFMFRNIQRQAGIVDENGKQKMTFHQLRHWFGSIAVKHHSDKHYVKKMMGHKNLSMTLDVYADYIDEPRSREEFLAMPDWLNPAAPVGPDRELAPLRPVAQQLLPAPAVNGDGPVLEGTAEPIKVPPEVVQPPLPYPVPDDAPDWLRDYVRLLYEGYSLVEICRAVRTSPHLITKDLRRLHMPKHEDLRRELRAKRLADLIGEGWSDLEIALKLGKPQTYRGKVWEFRQSLAAQKAVAVSD